MEMKHLKSTARLLDRTNFNRRGLDLSNEILWISVVQRAAELPAVKVGGKERNSAIQLSLNSIHPHLDKQQNIFLGQKLCPQKRLRCCPITL